MSSSSFLCDWENVSNVIKKIYEKIHFNESTCDIYTTYYIPRSPTHCSKVNLQSVLQCTKFTNKQNNELIFQTNFSSIKQRYMKLGGGLQRKRGKNKHTCPMFNNYFLASSNQMKLCAKDYIFSNQTGQHMWLQSPVFYAQWIDARQNHSEHIYIEHKRINNTTSEAFFQIPGW